MNERMDHMSISGGGGGIMNLIKRWISFSNWYYFGMRKFPISFSAVAASSSVSGFSFPLFSLVFIFLSTLFAYTVIEIIIVVDIIDKNK